MDTVKIPSFITNVTRQADADRLLERQWRLKAQRKQRGELHWLDDESEPGAWAKELKRRGIVE